MKKNIEWLKSAIQQNLDFYNDNDEEWQMAKVRAYAKSLDLINQLEETEVLSKEWISENVEYAYFDMLDGSGRLSSATAIIKPEKLRNLLAPKQELPVIPEFVAYVIEAYKSNSRLTNLLADLAFHGELAEFVEHEDEDEVFEWARSNRKATDEILARAWLDGFTVEEQKYYVLDKEGHLLIRGFSDGTVGRVGDRMKPDLYPDWNKKNLPLTEQEIKDYDPRYMTFAKPVEELEVLKEEN